MKTVISSPSRPLRRALCTALIGLAALWAMPSSAQRLYVAQYSSGNPAVNSIGEYDATTGAAINARFITGLTGPYALAVSDNDLFVTNGNGVAEYNATTGAAINPSFITGLINPYELAVAPVPEASPWWMMAGCGAALLGIMRLPRSKALQGEHSGGAIG